MEPPKEEEQVESPKEDLEEEQAELPKEELEKKQEDHQKEESKKDIEEKVENLEIPVYLEGKTLKGEIIENEIHDKNKRFVEFRKKKYPSYQIDDFSDINHYKAQNIKLPLQSQKLPKMKFNKKIFSGKVDLKCNDQTIYGVTIKANMSGKYEVIDFKNHDFNLTLILLEKKVINFFYKISENTVNIRGKNIYIFFKNLFSGWELIFRNKKISGHFKITSEKEIENLDIIIENIEKFLEIKKYLKIKEITLKNLLQNTRSLEVLYSYYTKTPKIIKGNITIRTYYNGQIEELDKLIISYPIKVNFLGIKNAFIEYNEINLDSSEITYENNKLEVQVFDTIQKITYEKIKK